MLPAPVRLRRGQDIREVVRAGRRSASPRLVVHTVVSPTADAMLVACPRVGFLVSKAVGGSVVRNRVSRQLRHLTAARLSGLPNGARLVVRALPAAADSSSDALGGDLDDALARVRWTSR